MAFKKIDKEFKFTDDSVNVYGFRLMSNGYMSDEFSKNPIGYHMHDRDSGVLCRWEDLRQEEDAWFAKPVINLNHPKGQQTCDEIQDGFLNGASVGKIVALEYSEDPALMLPGQTGPTVTKWYNRELSIVDIPGNLNSLSLFDKDGNAINLADFKTQSKDMKQLFLTPELIKALNLADNADQAVVTTVLSDLAAKAAKVDTIQGELTTALNDKATADTNFQNLQATVNEEKVTSQLEKALAEKKITKALSDTLAAQYKGKPGELKSLLDNMQPYTPVTSQLNDNTSDDRFKGKSYCQLDKEGALPALKAANIELFKQLFQAEYGVEYKG
jgi:hypothetical protein